MTKMLHTSYDCMILIADYKEPNFHRHLCSHLAFGKDGKLKCTTDLGTFVAKGVFIDSDTRHTIHFEHGPIYLFLFDETSAIGKQIKATYLSEISVAEVPDDLIFQLRTCVENSLDVKILSRQMLTILSDKMENNQKKEDDRILDALQYLEGRPAIEHDIIHELAGRECLSKSRLSHLFTQEMGVPLHRYLSFIKMKKAWVYILEGDTLTEAAIKAGFNSSSHFSSTVQRMFGISLTEFVKSMV